MERPPIIMTNTLLFALSGLTALIDRRALVRHDPWL